MIYTGILVLRINVQFGKVFLSRLQMVSSKVQRELLTTARVDSHTDEILRLRTKEYKVLTLQIGKNFNYSKERCRNCWCLEVLSNFQRSSWHSYSRKDERKILTFASSISHLKFMSFTFEQTKTLQRCRNRRRTVLRIHFKLLIRTNNSLWLVTNYHTLIKMCGFWMLTLQASHTKQLPRISRCHLNQVLSWHCYLCLPKTNCCVSEKT